MPVHVLRLGTPRLPGEGLRIGTVRRPPRGVPKAAFASGNWYDVWYPELAPSTETMQLGQAAQTLQQWQAFEKQYRREMAQPAAQRTLGLLAALSHHAAFSVGCYCQDPQHCHRSVLAQLLVEAGAAMAQPLA